MLVIAGSSQCHGTPAPSRVCRPSGAKGGLLPPTGPHLGSFHLANPTRQGPLTQSLRPFPSIQMSRGTSSSFSGAAATLPSHSHYLAVGGFFRLLSSLPNLLISESSCDLYICSAARRTQRQRNLNCPFLRSVSVAFRD